MAGSWETLFFTKDGKIGRLELTRPERLNAVAIGARMNSTRMVPRTSSTALTMVWLLVAYWCRRTTAESALR